MKLGYLIVASFLATTAAQAASPSGTSPPGLSGNATPAGGDITNTYATPYVSAAGKAAGNADYLSFTGSASSGASIGTSAGALNLSASSGTINVNSSIAAGSNTIAANGFASGGNGMFLSNSTGTPTEFIYQSGCKAEVNGAGLTACSDNGSTIGASGYRFSTGYITTAYLNQIIGAGSAPTIAAGTGAGTSPTVAITGTNIAGLVSVTTGTSPATSATLATITYNGTLAAAPVGCALMPRTAASALAVAMIYTTAPSTTTWTIAVGGTALTASTAYSWSYTCE